MVREGSYILEAEGGGHMRGGVFMRGVIYTSLLLFFEVCLEGGHICGQARRGVIYVDRREGGSYM